MKEYPVTREPCFAGSPGAVHTSFSEPPVVCTTSMPVGGSAGEPPGVMVVAAGPGALSPRLLNARTVTE